ncbi:MAG: glycerophosphodiester phosphodiesterase [Clostridiales bacterium]|nr:glycerophosphodiester phosphodiesterase [Clostridiales bacterium]
MGVFVEGHRGYCSRFPENTLISFRAAMELGVDGYEFDIWLSKDKVPVLMHDGNALRTCGVNRRLSDMTLDEIQQLDASYAAKFGDKFTGKGITVPTLRQLCELTHKLRPDIALGVEIKEYTEETVDLSVDLLKSFGLFDRAFFYAFDLPTIRYLKMEYKARTMGYPDFQMGRWEEGGYRFYDDIGLNMALVRSEIFDFYAAKQLPMHLYCADNTEDVRLCLRRGASLITANDPVPLMNEIGRVPGKLTIE